MTLSENSNTERCSCGAPEPCLAPRFGGEHVPREVWIRWEIEQNRARSREAASEKGDCET